MRDRKGMGKNPEGNQKKKKKGLEPKGKEGRRKEQRCRDQMK